ncbi:MAG: hypothetical protein BWX80_00847 [Candidatus Hydrogenedentes bacterium ADurb.Bin101]|nr:MAG: hypothetical protein BWX80_00847 [Candidatus Hydrogenedentes bacterium ADurb.Bin101]HOC68331.1 DUF503 domain-containing protein [Candidatus Hydrogenedentota bacterium]
MTIGLLQLDLLLPEANSLKDKRRVLKSLKDRLHNRFNCSVAETEYQDTWRRSRIAVCVVGGETAHVNSQLSSIVAYVEGNGGAVLADYRIEML